MPNIGRTALNSDVPAPTDGRSGGRLDQRRLPAMSGCDDMEVALAALRSCRSSLLTARVDAVTAVARLYGARAAKAGELSEKLAHAVAFCDRLSFIVERDLRADQ